MLFSFSPIDSYALPEVSEGSISIGIDATAGTMVIQFPDQTQATYPLIDEEAEPLTRVIYFAADKTPQQLQIGEVTYARPTLDVQYFPLNGYDIDFPVDDSCGSLGHIDIRDNARELPGHHYKFDTMPTMLSIEGNHLVVKTLQWESSDDVAPWHTTA